MLEVGTQLELPLQKTAKPNNKIHIKELTHSWQDLEVAQMASDFVNEIELQESISIDDTLRSCIRIRNDVERKYVNLFIAYEGDTAIGFLVGVTSPCFHRPGIVAEQKLWYVKPSRRSSRAAVLLMKAYERWARINGATQIFTGTANLQLAERTSKLLERLGYARVGYVHVKEI